MKIKECEISGWVPVEIKITVESIDEARALFHFFNHASLSSKLNEGWYDEHRNLNESNYREISNELTFKNCYSFMSNLIEQRGFTV